jgi:hypothetical protein
MGLKFIRSFFNRKVNVKETVNCLNCNKIIAHFINEAMSPSPEDCYRAGNVPVPNCGWFCSQECVNQFGQKHNIKFDRDENGFVDYYNDAGR